MLDETLIPSREPHKHGRRPRPTEFKARCALDAHRGQVLPPDIQYQCRCNAHGYATHIEKLIGDYSRPVPDRWWGTNCTPSRWQTAKKTRLMCSPLALWLWLLEYYPTGEELILSFAKAGEILGGGYPRTIHTLIRKKLVLGTAYQGGAARLYAVYEEPQDAKMLTDRLAKKGVTVVSPKGSKHYVKNRRQFAMAHGLDPTTFYALCDGEISQHYGWHL